MNRFWVGVLAILVLAGSAAAALRPEQVLVVANRHVPEGVELAAYYATRRGIPENNLLKLWAPEGENCSREAFERRIEAPIRERLSAAGGAELRALVVCFGMPLKVAPPPPSVAEQVEIEVLETERRGSPAGTC